MNLQEVDTRIPEVWVRQAQLQRNQADQMLITEMVLFCPKVESITTFGVLDVRHGVSHKGFGLDETAFMSVIADVIGVRVPTTNEINDFFEQAYNALGYWEAMFRISKYTIKNGVWTAS
jgi:hypothetical protein